MLDSLKYNLIDSKLGEILVISDDGELYFLEFQEKSNFKKRLENLKSKFKKEISLGMSDPIRSIESELNKYFDGSLKEFKTPINLLASEFQKKVWQELMKIPYGQTISYKQQASLIGCQKSYRAVANANGANKFAIIIPCHRVINSSGNLGGYAGGIEKKKWLIEHEKQN